MQEYFTSDRLLDTELKPQFLFAGSPNIPIELVGALKDLGEIYHAFDSIYGDEFRLALITNSSDALDSRSVAALVIADMQSIYDIFTKYAEYRTNVSL
jgi:hypothetical protein